MQGHYKPFAEKTMLDQKSKLKRNLENAGRIRGASPRMLGGCYTMQPSCSMCLRCQIFAAARTLRIL